MYKFAGYRRTSYKYAEAWRYLDSAKYVGEFRLLSTSEMRYLGKYGDSAVNYLRVKAPKGVDKRLMWQVADDQFSNHCKCEHDCCGHWQNTVGKVYRSKRNEYIVELRSYQNV